MKEIKLNWVMLIVIGAIFALAFYVGFQFNTAGEEILEENELLKYQMEQKDVDSMKMDSVLWESRTRIIDYEMMVDSLLNIIKYVNKDDKKDEDAVIVNNIPVSLLGDSLESRYRIEVQ